VVPFNLADIGEGIAEVEILQWFVQVGDHVNAFDRVCEVQSDKATVEISSRFDGEIVKIYHEVGGMANVGEPLVDIRRSGSGGAGANGAPSSVGSPPSPSSAGIPPPATDAPAPPSGMTGGVAKAETAVSHVASPAVGHTDPEGSGTNKPLATPAVRGLIKGMNLDIRQIPSTGRDGRVTKEDVARYLAMHKYENVTIDPPSAVADTTTSTPASELLRADNVQPAAERTTPTPVGEDTHVKVRGFMRTMIKTMQSQTAIPHFGYSDEYDVGAVLELRQQLQSEVEGTKLTYMPILIKALSVALTDFPEINAKFSKDMEEVIHVASHNIGIAVDTPTGLVVPNIKHVQQKSIKDIARDLQALASKARENRLTTEELSGGTLTLSNIGAIGGTYTSPILMPGEACIGAIGAIETIPRYDAAGTVVPVRVMRVSWSADHRLLAGATVARFSNRFKALLKDPSRMLLSLH